MRPFGTKAYVSALLSSCSANQAWVVFALALAIYWIRAIAWPLGAGRDAFSYFYFFYDMTNPFPEDRATMMLRTPLAPIFNVFLVSVLGPRIGEILMSLLYSIVVTLFFTFGQHWGKNCGWVLAGTVLVHHAYGSLFHVVSNDPVVVVVYAVLCWTLLRGCMSLRVFDFVLCGIAIGLMLLARPGVFAVLSLVPLFLRSLSFRARAIRVLAMCAGFLPFMVGWGYRNYVMYDSMSYSLVGDVVMPLCRVLQTDRLINENNGPASKELYAAVRTDIMPTLPATRGTSAEEYLTSSAVWMELVQMADRVWGQGEYGVLRRAAAEAILSDPMQFAGGVAKTFFQTFFGNLKNPVPLQNGSLVFTHKGIVTLPEGNRPLQEIDRNLLKRERETPIAWSALPPATRKGYELSAKLPTRDGSLWLGTWLNRMALIFPPILFWCSAGLVGCFFLVRVPENGDIALLALVVVAMATNWAACLAQGIAVYHYRLPFDPIYILWGMLGVRAIFRGRRTMRHHGNAMETRGSRS